MIPRASCHCDVSWVDEEEIFNDRLLFKVVDLTIKGGELTIKGVDLTIVVIDFAFNLGESD